VNPREIRSTVRAGDPTLKGNAPWHLGRVEGGDWDVGGTPVSEYWGVYPILKQRVERGASYGQIPEYRDALLAVDAGRAWYHCRTRAEVAAAWERFEDLYAAIRRDGYKTQAELGSGRPLDEVRIQVGRHGELLFEEGLHRLVIAQLLGLEKIPVLVFRRHAQWAELRDAVRRIVVRRGFMHQPFNHPDLDILPQWYGSELQDEAWYGDARWTQIEPSLPVPTGAVLDIGAYFGYFSHRFENLGFDCTAVELDRDNARVLRLYRDIMNRRFEIVQGSVFDLPRRAFDVVLALSVFHHLVKRREDHDRLAEFLRTLDCRALYFEPGDSGPAAFRRFSEEDFVKFVMTRSGLERCRPLGPTRVGRNLFLLTR
jgi:SAM-dependent methyltransferase